MNHGAHRDHGGKSDLLLVDLSAKVIAAAIEVHRELGPGLLESVYEACLMHELQARGVRTQRQVPVSIQYKNAVLDLGFRLDIVVEQMLVIELKAVDALNSLHDAQLLTYLKLSGLRVGLLMNFNASSLKRGLKRLVR
jgi:GxxExxY protein